MTHPSEPVVERTPEGAKVLVDGVVRATYVGDLDQPEEQAALNELLDELFRMRDAASGAGPGVKTRPGAPETGPLGLRGC